MKESLLAEVEMWHRLRDEGKLLVNGGGQQVIFHRDFGQHKEEEGTLLKVRNWASSWGAMLQERRIAAALARRRRAERWRRRPQRR